MSLVKKFATVSQIELHTLKIPPPISTKKLQIQSVSENSHDIAKIKLKILLIVHRKNT